MTYRLDTGALQQALRKRGYRNVTALAKAAGIHRNTIRTLLKAGAISRSVVLLAKQLQCDPLTLIVPASPAGQPFAWMDELQPMLRALVQHDPQLAITLFGSRARHTARRYADWDIGLVRWPTQLAYREFVRYKLRVEELTESVPRTVDVINWHQAPAWFVRSAAPDLHLLGGNPEAWAYLQGMARGLQLD